MQEKILSNKKHGMLVLVLTIVLALASIVGTVFGAIMLENEGSPILFIVSMIVLCIGWIPALGLRVLKPNEALVLTCSESTQAPSRATDFSLLTPSLLR